MGGENGGQDPHISSPALEGGRNPRFGVGRGQNCHAGSSWLNAWGGGRPARGLWHASGVPRCAISPFLHLPAWAEPRYGP